MTGGKRGGRAQDSVGGPGNAKDVLIDHQWACDPTEKSRRSQAGCGGPAWHAKEARLYL